MNTAPNLTSYAARMNRVVDHIHAHLEEDVSIDRLAEVACLSPWHWSRIYAAMQGETVAATIRRLRLQRAADRLANSGMEIDAIATRAGYASTDTFGRAFRDAFGQSPAAFRKGGSHAAFKAAIAQSDARGFPVAVLHLPDRRCAGIDHTGPYLQIDHAMGRLFTELMARASLPERPEMIGVFFDDPGLTPEAELRSRACMAVDASVAIHAPMVEKMLRGGLHARLTYTGPYADMGSAYRWLLGVWLPASGHEPDDAPVFEVYLDDPREVPQSRLRTCIHLPLKAP